MAGPKLLPGPDGTGCAKPPVTHRRSDRPSTFSFAVDESTEPDVEIVFANRAQDELLGFIMTELFKTTGDGRMTTTAHYKGRRYPVSDIEARRSHVLGSNGKMVERIELLDPNASPEPPPTDETPGPRYA